MEVRVLYRVYIDEAGDRGISRLSSRHFVVSAVIVSDKNDAHARSALAELRYSLERHPEHVLHFVKFEHSQRLKAAQDIAVFPISATVNVIIHKDLIGRPMPADDLTHISRPDPMYLWSLRLLLERISWCIAGLGGTGAIVSFARLKNFRDQKLHDYRCTLETSGEADIQWAVFDGHPFRIATPRDVELLQVADITASALFRAIEPDRYGNTEPRYFRQMAAKLFRQEGKSVTSCGLKTFPPDVSEPGRPLAFLSDF